MKTINEQSPASPARERGALWQQSNLSWRALGKRVWLEIYESSFADAAFMG